MEERCDGKTAWVKFTCADTGIGMSEEFQKHIFEPFTQEVLDARSTYGGTGLGMPIAKSLADKMGGTTSFESLAGRRYDLLHHAAAGNRPQRRAPAETEKLADDAPPCRV